MSLHIIDDVLLYVRTSQDTCSQHMKMMDYFVCWTVIHKERDQLLTVDIKYKILTFKSDVIKQLESEQQIIHKNEKGRLDTAYMYNR